MLISNCSNLPWRNNMSDEEKKYSPSKKRYFRHDKIGLVSLILLPLTVLIPWYFEIQIQENSFIDFARKCLVILILYCAGWQQGWKEKEWDIMSDDDKKIYNYFVNYLFGHKRKD